MKFAITLWFSALAAALSAAEPSPAERAVIEARAGLKARPELQTARSELAMALARRARESGDPAYYREALDLVDAALRRTPDDYQSQRTRTWLLLGLHRFAEALDSAERLNERAPDDLMVNAMRVDALIELGRYADAVTAAQWLLDLRPGATAGLTRAAYLRELHGDIDGSMELMAAALVRTPANEKDERAWLLTQLAHLHLAAGRVDPADQLIETALGELPGYHYALAGRVQVRVVQGRLSEAVAAAKEHYQAAPHPENRYRLAALMDRAGRTEEAKAQFELFYREALEESSGWDNANSQLIDYLLDHIHRPDEALTLAKREIARRRDIETLQRYAWALHHNGRGEAAWTAVQQALTTGSRSPDLLYRSGLIAAALGKHSAARDSLASALEMAPWHRRAAQARDALETLPIREPEPGTAMVSIRDHGA